jgi:hypothetical protein
MSAGIGAGRQLVFSTVTLMVGVCAGSSTYFVPDAQAADTSRSSLSF